MAFTASIATIPLYSHGGIKLSTKSKSYRSIGIRSRLRSEPSYKVAIIGAGGDVGQPLSLLIKMSPFVTSLSLYDATPTTVRTMAENLNHCNTPCHVSDFSGNGLGECVSGADVVVVVSRTPMRAGMTGEDVFRADVGAVKNWVEAVAEEKDENALVHVVSNSVESTVPVAAEVLKKRGVYDPRRLFGVTTLDVVRANTFVAKKKKELKMIDVSVPVVGGNGGTTALPLLSKMRPHVNFTEEEAAELTARVRGAEREVVDAKRGQGCATLSTAYAVARFVESSLRALDGEDDVYECAFVESSVTELPFFASTVKLGKDGVEMVVGSDLEGMSEYEEEAFQALKPELKRNIEKGLIAASYL